MKATQQRVKRKLILPAKLRGYSYSVEHGLQKRITVSTVGIASGLSVLATLPLVWWLGSSSALVLEPSSFIHKPSELPELVEYLPPVAEISVTPEEIFADAEVSEIPELVETIEIFEPWLHITVQPGDTLSEIFSNYELNKHHLYQIVAANKQYAKQLQNLRPGQQMRVRRDPQGNIEEFILHLGFASKLYTIASDDGFVVEIRSGKIQTEVATAFGEVKNSLSEAGYAAGLSDSVISRIMEIFRWDEDFRIFQKGDYFTVIYELHTYGEQQRFGNILAVEVFNQNQFYSAVAYAEEDLEYYHLDGTPFSSKTKPNIPKLEPLMVPVSNARISSHFGMRIHPVFRRARFHSGVDYAAPTGTPILAASNATVTFKGWQNGYGRTVTLQHDDQRYSSLYAHMSDFADIKVGDTIKQGTIIGYIGQSGTATGPHLHYEVLLDGQPQNPLTLEIPNEAYEKQLAELEQQEAQRVERFMQATAELRNQLAEASQRTKLALGVKTKSNLAKAAGIE